jgi:parallel beta-helix repeat protein
MNVRKNLGIRLAACVLMLALAVAVKADADTHYVSPGQSIQAAIDASSNGDKIEVAPGTYNEAIIFKGKAVRLYSSDGPEVTTIDATGLSYSVVRCFNGEDANTVLDGFTITGGNANNGGGMENYGTSPTVNNCTFRGNTAGDLGGGMSNYIGSNPTVTNCNFSGNTSKKHGGGMCNRGSSSPTVTNCTFTENSSVHWGGGMYNDVGSHSIVTNCTFSGNVSDTGGGGIGNYSSSPTVTNCTFSDNNSPDGGGMCNNGGSNPTVTNCILWGDIGGEIFDSGTSSTTVTSSDVEGGWGGTGNINADPCFVDAAGGYLRLLCESPCVDAGDNNAPNLPATDLAGNQRISDGDGDGSAIVDMGAYELYGVLNITQCRAYIAIQPAIDDANDGDEIQVAPGTYNEAIDFKGKAVRLYSGGPDVTIIDGTGNYHVVQCVSGEDANTVLEGFTITGGNANGTDPNDRRGGGMFNFSSSPMVTNCTFTGNSAAEGGAIHNSSSNPTVADCTFSNNTATWDAGGMYNTDSNPAVTNCSFSNNTATNAGAGMCNYTNSSPTVTECTFTANNATQGGSGMLNWGNSSPTVTGCTFTANTTSSNGGGMLNVVCTPTITNCTFNSNHAAYGGGMYNNQASPTMTNCIFINNSVTNNGAGMINQTMSSPTVTNCTFTMNSALSGGGMFNYGHGGASYPTVTNCIFWGDTPNEIWNIMGSVTTITYSDIQGGYTGAGNINAYPCFVDADNPNPNLRNLQLKPDSPCIDAGNTTAVPGGTWADIGGNPRVLDDPKIPDTGVSLSGLTVDMGAYEFYCSGIGGDVNCDGVVDFKDIAILAGNWLAGTEPEL